MKKALVLTVNGERHELLVPADATLLLAVSGCWRSAGEALQPMQGLLWEASHGPLAAEALEAGAALLHVRLCHDHQP